MPNLIDYKKKFDFNNQDYSKLSNQNISNLINEIKPLHENVKKDMLELIDIEEYLMDKYVELIKILNERS